MAWAWIDRNVVLSIHHEQIAEHGGQAGLRDQGVLDSALSTLVDQKSNWRRG